jgi:hypothetical protein
MKTLPWHPHTEHPTKPTTALIASEVSEDMPGEYVLVGPICMWRQGRWVEEVSGDPLDTDMPFFWLDECDLVATIRPPVSHH